MKNSIKKSSLFIMICSLVASLIFPLNIKANEITTLSNERAVPSTTVTFTHKQNVSTSGTQSFTVKIICTKTTLGVDTYVTSYTSGNYSLSSVTGGTAKITGDGVISSQLTPDKKYSSYCVEVDVSYTPSNTSSTKKYTVKFYIVNGELYDSACEAQK